MKAALISLALLTAFGAAHADTDGRDVFVSVGAHGEVSFSDVATPGAERRSLPVVEQNDDALADLDRRIQQTLEVARVLEESRLAREKARAEARAAAAPAPPVTVVQEHYTPYRYVHVPHRFFPGHARHRPHKPRRHDPPDAEPPAEAVLRSRMVWRED